MIGSSLEAASRFHIYDDDDEYLDQGGDESFFDDDEEEAHLLLEVSSPTTLQNEEDDKEKQAIQLSRTGALVVLCLTAIIVGHVVFFFLREDEHTDFRNSFRYLSREVAKAADSKLDALLSGFEHLSSMSPLVAWRNGETLPFATSIEWMELAAKLQQEDSCLTKVFYAPWLAGPAQLREWELYASSRTEWFRSVGNEPYNDYVWTIDETSNASVRVASEDMVSYLPLWQTYPLPKNTTAIQLDLVSVSEMSSLELGSQMAFLSEMIAINDNRNVTTVWDFLDLENNGTMVTPQSIISYPISDGDRVVAQAGGILLWGNFFDNLTLVGNVLVVLEICDENATFRITQDESIFLDYGDAHEIGFESMVFVHQLELRQDESGEDSTEVSLSHGCTPTLYIFPTKDLENQYASDAPILFTFFVAAMFSVSIFLFSLYDAYITRRQNKVEKEAHRTDAIVEQMFPGRLREMILQHSESDDVCDDPAITYKHNNIEFNPIVTQADFYPDISLLFADIVGFTAWSSMREPSQVFVLLETIFSAFDEKARARGIFKVETVGDCYVAAAGIPDFRKDHAVAMARFARDCLSTFRAALPTLVTSMGPDTTDLGIRIGVHSGPVTAGVLRGERARYQLFGDTVNTTSRLESSCMRNRIQISEQTAQLLKEMGRQNWFTPRVDKVEAKGIGFINTYWLKTHARSDGDISHTGRPSNTLEEGTKEDAEEDLNAVEMDARPSTGTGANEEQNRKIKQLVDWNVENLSQLLKHVVAQRQRLGTRQSSASLVNQLTKSITEGHMVVEEVAETIQLPEFDVKTSRRFLGVQDVELDQKVMDELRVYVQVISTMYKTNPFHNFEHATHVALAMRKLLSRIVAPKLDDDTNKKERNDQDMATLEARKHDHTYGIASDPLTHFAVVFSAVIHDVDHRGISNGLLALEDPTMAAAYKSKSIAEQNSVDIAWFTLLSEEFSNLRGAIFCNVAELRRFRQLLVNAVIATDIFDKEQSTLRKNRWEKAFSVKPEDAQREDINRKATIVIEHLIQASDVSHTMAHWAVYQKWNERLFWEMLLAFRAGRCDKDPSLGWYQGELWFFDNYVIPLTQKLKECGVFGVSSDEYLKYALANREEWRLLGEAIVEGWKRKYAVIPDDSNKSPTSKAEVDTL